MTKQLANSKLPAKNLVINYARYATGDPSITDWKTAKNIVDDEVERLVTNAAVTVQGKAMLNNILSSNESSDQQLSQINTLIKIMGGRLSTAMEQYKSIMGKDAPEGFFMYPDTRAALGISDTNQQPSGGNLSDDIKSQYNKLRSSGMSSAEAKKKLGL